MAKTRATSGLDLHLDLAGSRVRTSLEAALREAARSGRLLPGTRLPSSRVLATLRKLSPSTPIALNPIVTSTASVVLPIGSFRPSAW